MHGEPYIPSTYRLYSVWILIPKRSDKFRYDIDHTARDEGPQIECLRIRKFGLHGVGDQL